MADPTTTNQVASVINQILKALIEDTGEGVAETALIAQYPWLGLPFIKQIFEFILSKVSAFFYQAAANLATTIVVDVQTNLEASNANQAFQNLTMAVASGDQAAIQKASDDLSMAYGSLIHYDGAAPP